MKKMPLLFHLFFLQVLQESPKFQTLISRQEEFPACFQSCGQCPSKHTWVPVLSCCHQLALKADTLTALPLITHLFAACAPFLPEPQAILTTTTSVTEFLNMICSVSLIERLVLAQVRSTR